MAFRIIMHAFRMVFGNFGAALRISMPMIVVGILAAIFVTPRQMSDLGTPAEQLQNYVTGPF